MQFFIPKLEAKLGMKLETKLATTSDGVKYTTYDVDATAEKNKGVEDLAQKINTAAESLRQAKRNDNLGLKFVIHQGVIREANNSLTELRKSALSLVWNFQRFSLPIGIISKGPQLVHLLPHFF